MFYLFLLALFFSPCLFYIIFRNGYIFLITAILAAIPTYIISTVLADFSAWGDGATIKTTSNFEVFFFLFPLVLLFNFILTTPFTLIQNLLKKRRNNTP